MAKGATSKAKSPALQLAAPGDPLVWTDGSVVQAQVPGKEFKKPPSTSIDPQTFKGKKQRNIKDLPAKDGTFHALAAVLAYSFMGVGDREIADALRCSVADLDELRKHAGYLELFETVFGEIISADSESLTGRIAAYSHGALNTVAHLSTNAAKEETKLRASTDILDRAGVRPKDMQDKNKLANSTLRIQILDSRDGSVDINLSMDN